MDNAHAEIEQLVCHTRLRVSCFGFNRFRPQKCELGVLQAQLEATKGDKSELLRRLKKVKDTAREAQEKSGVM